VPSPKQPCQAQSPSTSDRSPLADQVVTTIGLIDYGMGNLHSVRQAFRRLGQDVVDVKCSADLEIPDALILPGVGAFDPAMENLESTGLVPHLKSWAEQGRPLLGICLGLQLLFEGSSEGKKPGLSLLPGRVEALPRHPSERIPHMGWAPLKVVNNSPLLRRGDPQAWVYFVHSFAAVPSDDSIVAATAPYGDSEVAAMVWSNSIGACQFHPEKSSDSGVTLLKHWIDWLQTSSSLEGRQTCKAS
jgi:glutamine amidotransferase